jgi:NAD(P)-dependent dehydrogenase (short-subunit alcohol dehydrogenase family)
MSFARYPSLDGRAVFISGGASGIGEALVRAFAAQGAQVAFVDLDGEAGGQVAREAGAWFSRCDVTDAAAYEAALHAAAEETGPFHVLVNNAARDDRHRLADLTSERWDALMAVNLKHQAMAARIVAPMMAARGSGAILNMGSVAYKRALPIFPAYAAAKAAISTLTRVLARELGPSGVRVNAILPGAVETERQTRLWATRREDVEAILAAQAIRHRLQPDDVARMALFLASDDARGCTGQEFIVDAGLV